MKTAATEMLGIEFPIFAFSHCRDVVAAVSKAGGLGVLGAVAHSPEQLEIDLAWIEAEIGDRPYGVDLIVPAKYAGDEGGGYTLDDIRGADPRHASGVRRRHPAPLRRARVPTRRGLARPVGPRPVTAVSRRSARPPPGRSWRSRSPTRPRSSRTRSARHRSSSSTG